MTQMQQMTQWLTRLVRAVNEDAPLMQRGKHVDTLMLLDTGETQHLLDIRRGRIESLSHGPFVMPRWDFALRALTDAATADDARRVLRVEGDLHPFMSNLFYFKALMAAPRGAQAFTPEAIGATR